MKRIVFLLVITSLMACESSNEAQSVQAQTDIEPTLSESSQQAEPFVVLELFTSEGCSDCPTAEAWLNELALEAFADRSYMYALSFHVDYWNKLGWRDIFSDSAYSNRQRRYRKAFGNEVVYTPQMVVNGTEEFVGSDRDRTRKAMKEGLRRQPPLYFHIEPDEAWTKLHYTVVDADDTIASRTDGYLFQVAIVERGLVTEVKRGENKNKTLKHENVVRYFDRYPLKMEETVPLKHNLGPFDENFSIVALVQNRETMAIVGANIWNY